MTLSDILSVDTGRKARTRVGRGIGSGKGKTCGRGSKGEGSRTGGRNRGPLFEGGQFPLWQRLPKRGFSNHRHARRYVVLQLARVLESVSAEAIDIAAIQAAGLARVDDAVKVVAGVQMARAVTLTVNKVTASVRQAVEAAGGKVVELDG